MRTPSPASARAGLKTKVLIVDDDERNAFAATEALQSLGHELVVARSGEEALRVLLTDEFAVILLDLHMPGMDGYETAKLIREHPRTRDTPIVFVTAVFRDEAHIFQAYTVGAVDVVFKPADPFVLRSKVAILIELHLKTLELRRQAEESQRLLDENARVNADKQAAEKALQEARERQDAILRSLPIVFTSRASTHPFGALFVSDSITPLTGFTPARFIEEPEIGLGRIHPEDIQGVVDCLMQASESGAYACEYRWLCADGAYRIFLDQGVLAPSQDGMGSEILGTILDITERRSLEEQLTQARKMEAVGQLTGGVAHDFNNLLTVVVGCVDILSRQHGDDPRFKRYLDAIKTASDRGQNLTRQLLAFSRRQPLNPVVTDLNERLREFAPLIQQAVGDGVTLSLDLASQPLCSNIDASQLDNALLNLAVNARDAMNKEGSLFISLSSRGSADEGSAEACISVRDTGSGMSSETAQRIFEPFYTTKETGRGSGLGLSQVYGFVNQSGGRIEVKSAPGEGAMFQLFLPLSSERPAVTAAPSPPTALGGNERILIVEDDAEVLDLCVEMLRGLGYQCFTATNAQEALEALAAEDKFDLLFSDVVMPGGLNGIELARRAQELRPELRVLLTSGYVGEDGVAEAHAFPLLNKPYQQNLLANHLRSVLDAEKRQALSA